MVSRIPVIVSLAIGALSLVGCELNPRILSARSHPAGGDEVVQVSLRRQDAARIKNRQLYFRLVVGNCADESDGYPAEAYIGGQRASEFAFSTDSESVQVVGRVPSRIFDAYRRPCVYLRGGGYLTGTIESDPVPILRVLGAGPNNSFKPKPLRGSA